MSYETKIERTEPDGIAHSAHYYDPDRNLPYKASTDSKQCHHPSFKLSEGMHCHYCGGHITAESSLVGTLLNSMRGG